jgi:hypothetical protein
LTLKSCYNGAGNISFAAQPTTPDTTASTAAYCAPLTRAARASGHLDLLAVAAASAPHEHVARPAIRL